MFNHKEIEKKWQKKWSEQGIYTTSNDSSKPKYYVLDMFPYPSGVGLHVGHPKGYIATDVTARMKMMQGYNVLHPMGWDAFGLPTENYAIQHKINPRIAAAENVAMFKRQLEHIGFTYDWSREINTTDPNYYRWTQWTFLQMFKKGLAYESYEPINWCPSCKTGLANEDLEDGRCERCGSEIEQKPMRQWVIKITAYAERLLNDLEKLPAWEHSIKDMQRAWIGKSEGVEIDFRIANHDSVIKAFTTRIDTIFGCTYIVIAPEHPLIEKIGSLLKNRDDVARYCEDVKNKTDLQRTDLSKDKTGVRLEGVEAINPFTHETVPVFVADYVLGSYGTGAVMAVPAHDERDWEFAKKYNLPIKKSIMSPIVRVENECFTDDGILIDSGEFTSLISEKARKEMTARAEHHGFGKPTINYKLKDWVFSRQRYWGEPIPIVHCEACGAVPFPEDQLPLMLPDVERYEPTDTGESPLANISDWVNTVCPSCGGQAKRETNTMPQWAGSSWYYLRYIDPLNATSLVDEKKEKYWSPVDLYVGGAEHATRHLIYARFWHKFLFDIGVVSHDEPFTQLQHVGLIIGEDGRKMSKRWGNSVNPNEVIASVGADSLRIYEMFMGPFTQSIAWNSNGVVGARRFLDKVWRAKDKIDTAYIPSKALEIKIHQTIKKVTEDIDGFKFNTAISALMILANEFEGAERISENHYAQFLQILAPFAPHLSEELWEVTGHTESIFLQSWPAFDSSLITNETFNLVIQVNGKLRDTIEVSSGLSDDQLQMIALEREVIKKWIDEKHIQKVIVIPNKLVNIVL